MYDLKKVGLRQVRRGGRESYAANQSALPFSSLERCNDEEKRSRNIVELQLMHLLILDRLENVEHIEHLGEGADELGKRCLFP